MTARSTGNELCADGGMERPSEVMDPDVNSDVSAFRDTKWPVLFPVRGGVTCHRCGSGEVYQHTQTLDMPMELSCLNCGLIDASAEFNRASVGD